MTHEVQVVVQENSIGDVVAARPVLTGHEGEADLVDQHVLGRRGAEVADRALLVVCVELIEVVAAGPQSVDLDMDRVGELR